MAKEESRNDRNVRVHLHFGNLSLEGAIVPQVHGPYNVVVNGFESLMILQIMVAAEHLLNKCHLLNLT